MPENDYAAAYRDIEHQIKQRENAIACDCFAVFTVVDEGLRPVVTATAYFDLFSEGCPIAFVFTAPAQEH